jgi:hypothetical protein
VLPFNRDNYQADFTREDARLDFGTLLGQASAVFELNGDRNRPGEAYAASARAVLNQSDVLLALWEGEKDNGHGGTMGSVQIALKESIPVLWFDLRVPGAVHLVRSEVELHHALRNPADAETVTPATLKHLVHELLHAWKPPGEQPPASGAGEPQPVRIEPALWKEYLKERWPHFDGAGIWRGFCTVLGGAKSVQFANRNSEGQTAAALEPASELPPSLRRLDDQLRDHFMWANRLAVCFANRHRSLFIFNYLMAVVAVFAALASTQLPKDVPARGLLAIAELLIITAIVAFTVAGRKLRWHEKWIDYRILAERIRQIRILSPLGGKGVSWILPEHLGAYANPASSWMAAHVRNIERDLGLPQYQASGENMQTYRRFVLNGFVREQVEYFESIQLTFMKMEKRLHQLGLFLFLLTWAACLLHFLPRTFESRSLDSMLIMSAALFPALGAALFSIRNQAELQRTAKRASALLGALKKREEKLIQFDTRHEMLSMHDILPAATEFSQLLVNHSLDWQVVFVDRPPDLPG